MVCYVIICWVYAFPGPTGLLRVDPRVSTLTRDILMSDLRNILNPKESRRRLVRYDLIVGLYIDSNFIYVVLC